MGTSRSISPRGSLVHGRCCRRLSACPFEFSLNLGGDLLSMTASSLRNQSCKELAQMARTAGLAGWHSMRKDELVKALVNHARRRPKRGANSAALAHTEKAAAEKTVSSKEKESLRQLRNRLT